MSALRVVRSAGFVTRRVLLKLGIVKCKPYTCKRCGCVVPLMGSRQWQAAVAYLHFETKHWDPTPASHPPSPATGADNRTTTHTTPETGAGDEGESDE